MKGTILVAQQSSEQQDVDQRSKDKRVDKLDKKPGYVHSFFNSRYESINSRKYVDYFYRSVKNIMEEVKSDENNYHHDEDKHEYCKEMGIPSPKQYEAFNALYSCVNSDYFDKHKKGLYNIARLSRCPVALNLLKGIYDNFEIEPVKKIKIICGSFWRKPLWLRSEIINYLNKLNTEYKIEVEIFNNCAKNEDDEIKKLNENIYPDKFYPLKRRAMIHYILIYYKNGDTKLYIEYPHSEKHYLRLYMLLTPEDMNSPELKDKRELILQFLEGIIEKASN